MTCFTTWIYICVWLLSSLLVKADVSEKPNVLIIIADDLGWHDIGLHNELFQTPNIDKLITESIKLDFQLVKFSTDII